MRRIKTVAPDTDYAWMPGCPPPQPYKQIVYTVNSDILQAGNYVGNYVDALKRMNAWRIEVQQAQENGKNVYLVSGRVSMEQSAPEDDTAGLRTLDEVIVGHIETVLHATQGNKTDAARILGIKRTTLVEKMKKLGMM